MGKLKDPNQPRRPLTAYFRWMGDNRKQAQQENPELKNKDLTKLLGHKWSNLTTEEKNRYQEPAKKEMEAWKVLMTAYKKTDEYKEFQQKKKAEAKQKEENEKKKKKKFPKDKNAPKRPSTGFFLFVADKREEVKKSLPEEERRKVTIITKKCGLLWRDAGVEGQAVFKAKASKLKEEWNVTMAEYKKTDDYTNYQDKKKEFSREQKEKAKEEEKKKKKKLKQKSTPKVDLTRDSPQPRRFPLVVSSDSDSSDSSTSDDDSS